MFSKNYRRSKTNYRNCGIIRQGDTVAQQQLAEWLVNECERRDLAWSVASRRVGVSPNTISEIVNGTPVGVKRILPFADLFSVPREFVLRLAGLLPAESSRWVPPKIAHEARVSYLVERLAALTPEAQGRVIDAALVLLEFAEAADHAQRDAVPDTDPTAA